MNIPPKYEDLVFQLNELNKREAALRESLTDKREEYNKLGDRYDALQQRLTVAEKLLQRVHQADALPHCCPLWKAIDAALKPAAEVDHGKA